MKKEEIIKILIGITWLSVSYARRNRASSWNTTAEGLRMSDGTKSKMWTMFLFMNQTLNSANKYKQKYKINSWKKKKIVSLVTILFIFHLRAK